MSENPFLDYFSQSPRANPFFAPINNARMQAGGALPQEKVSEIYGFGKAPDLGLKDYAQRYIADPAQWWLGKGAKAIEETASGLSPLGPTPELDPLRKRVHETADVVSSEAEKRIQGFESKLDEQVATADNPFLAAFGKSAKQVAGYAAQGAVVAPGAHAAARALPIASKLGQGAVAATLGGLEEAAFELPEGGNPFVGGAVGAVMGALPFVKSTAVDLEIPAQRVQDAWKGFGDWLSKRTTPPPAAEPTAAAAPTPAQAKIPPPAPVKLDIEKELQTYQADTGVKFDPKTEEALRQAAEYVNTQTQGKGADEIAATAYEPTLEQRAKAAEIEAARKPTVEVPEVDQPTAEEVEAAFAPHMEKLPEPEVGADIADMALEPPRPMTFHEWVREVKGFEPMMPNSKHTWAPGTKKGQQLSDYAAEFRSLKDNGGAPTKPVGAMPMAKIEAPPPVETPARGAPPVEAGGGFSPVHVGKGHKVAAGPLNLQGKFGLVEADGTTISHDPISLEPNEGYTYKQMQNRAMESGRTAVELKMQEILGGLDPQRMGWSATADTGAPIIDANGQHITGNGRMIALNRMYQAHPEKAGMYKTWLRENAEQFGLTLEQIDSMKSPVLVMQAKPGKGFDPVRFAEAANKSNAQAINESELAAQDAGHIRLETLDLFAESAKEGADQFGTAQNTEFLKSFSNDVGISTMEMGTYFDAETAAPLESLLRRAQKAMLALAYRDPEMIAKMAQGGGKHYVGLTNALTRAAIDVGKVNRLVDAGQRHPHLDFSKDVADAVAKLDDLRIQKADSKDKRSLAKKVDEFIAQDANAIVRHLSDEGSFLLKLFSENLRKKKANPETSGPGYVENTLRRYAHLVDQAGDPNQASMFETGPPPTKMELLEQAAGESHLIHSQQEGLELLNAQPATHGVFDQGDVTADPVLALVTRLMRRALEGGGNMDFTPWESANAWMRKSRAALQRYFTTADSFAPMGQRGLEYAEKKRLVNAQIKSHEVRHTRNMRNLTKAVTKWQQSLAKEGVDRTESQIYEELLHRIEQPFESADARWRGIDPTVAKYGQDMRAHVDELSGAILDDGSISKELRKTIQDNVGAYVRRTFALHRDPEAWQRYVREENPWIWENMRTFLREVYPERPDTEIEWMMENWLDVGPELYMAAAKRSGSKGAGRAPRDIFMRRKRTYLVETAEPKTQYRRLQPGEAVVPGERLWEPAVDAQPKIGEAAPGRYGLREMPGYQARLFFDKAEAEAYADDIRKHGRPVEFTDQEGLPEVWDDFLGLEKDPRARVGDTVVRMAQYIQTQRFLTDVNVDLRENGLLMTEKEGGKQAGWVEIKGGSERNPLSGQYAPREIAMVLQGVEDAANNGEQSAWVRRFLAINAGVRIGKTAGSIQTHFRNLVSWGPMLAANGHFAAALRVGKAGKILTSVRGEESNVVKAVNHLADAIETRGGKSLADAVRLDSEKLAKIHLLGVELGVIGEGGHAGDVRHWIERLKPSEGKLGVESKGSMPKEAIVKVGKVMHELYAREDDLGKVVAWLSEAKDHQWAHGTDFDTALRESAPTVRDLYPTYSKAVAGVKILRDFPFLSDFPTFWGEVLRNTKNIAKRGHRDLWHGENARVKALGAKRLSGLLTATVLGVEGIQMSFRMMSGSTKEDEETARQAGPPWWRNADLAIVRNDQKGNMTVFDISYMNPYAILREPIRALMRQGPNWDERLWDASMEVLDPFAAEGILTSTIADISRNRVKGGTRQIRQPRTPLTRQAKDVGTFAFRRTGPGTYASARRISYALRDEVDPQTGRKYNLEDELIAIGLGSPIAMARWGVNKITDEDYDKPFPVVAAVAPGARQVEISLADDLHYGALELRRRRTELSTDWNRMKPRLTPKQRLRHRRENEQAWEREQDELIRKVERFEQSGLTRKQISRALRDAGLSEEMTRNLLLGRYTQVLKP